MGLISASIEQACHGGGNNVGTIPATPGFQILRFVPRPRFKRNIETVKSARSGETGTPRTQFIIGSGAAGSLNFELSYGTYDALLAAVLCNDWNSDVLKNGVAMKSFRLRAQDPHGGEHGGLLPVFRECGSTASALACRREGDRHRGPSTLWEGGGLRRNAALAGATYATRRRPE